jgi:hypothetical protein
LLIISAQETKTKQLSKIAKDKTMLQSEQEIKIATRHTEQSFSFDTSRAGKQSLGFNKTLQG